MKIKAQFATFLMSGIILFGLSSCSDDDSYSSNTDAQSEYEVTIATDVNPGDTLLVVEDIASSLKAQINAIYSDKGQGEVTSLKVVSVQVASADVTDLSYMDKFELYLAPGSDTDIGQNEIPEDARFIGEASDEMLSEPSLNLPITNGDIPNSFSSRDHFDAFVIATLNENIQTFQSNRIIEFKITFRALIEG